jgi:hypothetical protein
VFVPHTITFELGNSHTPARYKRDAPPTLTLGRLMWKKASASMVGATPIVLLIVFLLESDSFYYKVGLILKIIKKL